MRVAAIAVIAVAGCDRSETERRDTPPPPSKSQTIDAMAAANALDAAPAKTFSESILDIASTYPSGGGYAWPAPKGTHGTTRDLFVAGERIAVATDSGSHCVGLTFEVFWRALDEQPGGIASSGLSADQARGLLREWFVPRTRGRGPADALPGLGLGLVVDDLDDARPGDFVQVWFNNDRGHSMIFHAWVRDDAGAITGIDFWSSQPWTDGIGRSTRAIGEGPRDIDRDAIFIARAAARPTTSE